MKKLTIVSLLSLILFAVTLKETTGEPGQTTSYKEYNAFFNDQLTYLSSKYDCGLLSFRDDDIAIPKLASLLDKNIIIDTVITGHYLENGQYFIKARSNYGHSFSFAVKCSREMLNSILGSHEKHFLMAVKVNSLKTKQQIVELDSIDERSIFVKNGTQIILSGEGLESVELPYSKTFSSDNY